MRSYSHVELSEVSLVGSRGALVGPYWMVLSAPTDFEVEEGGVVPTVELNAAELNAAELDDASWSLPFEKNQKY